MSESLFSSPSGPHAVITRAAWWLEQVAFGLLLFLVAWMPWLFSRTQLDPTELPKQTVLIVSAGIVWLLLVVHDALRGAWHIAWDRWSKLLFGSMAILAILALCSRDPYGSWVGITKQIPTAMFTMAAGAAWWLAIRRLVTVPFRFLLLLAAWLGSAGLLAWGTTAWLLGKTVWPWSLSVFRVITPAGSVSEVATFLVPVAVGGIALLFQGSKILGHTHKRWTIGIRFGALALILPSLLLIGAVGNPVLWIALAVGIGALLGILETPRARLIVGGMILLCLVSFALTTFSPTWNPWHLLGNRISLTVPAEVTLGTKASWSIALKGLEEHPLRGRGAGTWVNLFLQERDPALNQSPFVNVRFFQGSSSAATVVGTAGVFGILAWLLWLLLPGVVLGKRAREEHASPLRGFQPYLLALWLAYVVLWFGAPFAVIHLFFFWVLSAFIFVSHTTKIHTHAFRFEHPSKGILPLSIAVIAAFVCAWVGMQRFLAERLFLEGKQALEAQQYAFAERELGLAHAWNPWTDVYTSLLSQAYAQEARTRFAQHPPAAALPEIVARLTRAEQLNREAREQNPDRIESWYAAAAIASTRNLLASPTERTTADTGALLRAEVLNPSNPQIAILLANTYLQRAEFEQLWLSSTDEQVKTAARLRTEEATREALRWFERADALQPRLPAVAAGRARLALLTGNTSAAIQALEELQTQGNRTQELQIQIALLYEQAGKTDLTLRLLEALAKDHPEDAAPLARWTLVRLYTQHNRLDEAIRLLESLATQFPKESVVQQQLAELKRVRLEQERARLTPASATSTTSTAPSKPRRTPRRR